MELCVVDDQGEQRGAVSGGAEVDVAQDTRTALLVVGGHAVLVAELAHGTNHLPEGIGLEGAVKAGNDLVGLGGVKSRLHAPLALSHGVHAFVAVATGYMLAVPLDGQHGADDQVGQPRLTECLLHAAVLGDQLVLIFQMAVHATAAGLGSRTKLLLRTHGRGGDDLGQLAHEEGLSAFDDLRLHHVPRDGALDEHHKPPVGRPLGHSGHAATEVVQVMDGDRYGLGTLVFVELLLRHRIPFRPPSAGNRGVRLCPDRSR